MYWKLKKIFLPLDPLRDEIPWITYPALKWLENNINTSMTIFEWGSGGSTLYFSKRLLNIISIEHDTDWFRKIKQKILSKKIKNIDYKLIKPQRDVEKISKVYKSIDEEYKNMNFKKYCEIIKTFKDRNFDFVIVDGRARVGCVQNAVDKVKPGGYLILDNSERESYKKAFSILKGWKRIDFGGFGPVNSYPWRTTVFQKSV